MEHTCCFTGHRPGGLPWGDDEASPACLRLKAALLAGIQALADRGVKRFISGMALGVDTYAAEAVIEARRRGREVSLVAAVPFRGQSARWSAAQRRRYDALLAQADAAIVLNKRYVTGCLQQRNRYMVEQSGYVLAVLAAGRSASRDTAELAASLGRRVVVVEPLTCTFSRLQM